MTLVSAHLPAAVLFFFILAVGIKQAGLYVMDIIKGLKFFWVLLLFVCAARSVAVTGDTLFNVSEMAVSRQGVSEGLLVSFKFLLVMLTGLLFSATTLPSAVKRAVQWFLKPVPFVPEKRVAVMISLSLYFIPVVLKQAKEISDAQKSRCGDLEKNPVKRIIRLVLPLLKKTFSAADNLILAMESRCYTDDRTDPEFTPSGKEPWFLAGTILLCLGFVWL
jgi:energy-coupling factor transporter transmembrane protein EcfT